MASPAQRVGDRMRIYIAAPYTKGDTGENLNRVFKIADLLVSLGHDSYIPHLSHFWHIVTLRKYQFWIRYDETFIEHWAEAVFRIEGESEGADSEVKLAKDMGIPVYYQVDDIPRRPFSPGYVEI